MSQASGNRKPEWFPPSTEPLQLMVKNSLTQSLVPFKTQEGNQVKWYGCGPTVYDSAHLGHARAYVTFDILRRVLSDYFNYDVYYVMNITDVDDKIILRARRNYLVAEYKKNIANVDQLIADGKDAYQLAIESSKNKVDELENKFTTVESRFRDDLAEQIEHEKLKYNLNIKENDEFIAAINAITPEMTTSEQIEALIGKCQGVLAAKLDKEKGHTVTDQSIYKAHSEYYEREFLEDMQSLGVRGVDALTRVTEYVAGIITFIQQIVENGFGYVSEGSVYFDTEKFMAAKDADGVSKYFYAKLKPNAVGNLDLAAEGEGSIAAGGEKKHPNDFALWKTSKAGEPQWDSPWGLGRPGWHIECSAMATDLLGTVFDVHSGGEDLKFPHHDNELAQSEAFSGERQWVNYFFHAGHLSIEGLKMSKSLKNFVTIRQCLQMYTARQIRLLFLAQRWDGPMSFSDQQLRAAASREQTIKTFFQNIQVYRQKHTDPAGVAQFWDQHERALHDAFDTMQRNIHAALCDNFNYPQAVLEILQIITETNKYMKHIESTDALPKMMLLNKIDFTVNKYFKIFGAVRDTESHFLDQYKDHTTAGSSGSDDQEQYITQVFDLFCSFRDRVRAAAKDNEVADIKQLRSALLSLCDTIRDDELITLGVRLEDKASGEATWKRESAAELLREKQQRLREKKEKELSRTQNAITTKTTALNKFLTAYVTAAALKKYQKFTEDGIPTTTVDGAEITADDQAAIQQEWGQSPVYNHSANALKQYAVYERNTHSQNAIACSQILSHQDEPISKKQLTLFNNGRQKDYDNFLKELKIQAFGDDADDVVVAYITKTNEDIQKLETQASQLQAEIDSQQ